MDNNIPFTACLTKIHKKWNPIFKMLADDIGNIFEQLDKIDNVTPPRINIFEAFMIDPEYVTVIIIGQDPYPALGDANGLCFSTHAKICPASLKNVLTAIGYLPQNVTSFDFHHYVYQGVLLLNVSLTTEVGKPNAHKLIWSGVIKRLLELYLSKYENITPYIFAWGNDAKITVDNIMKYVNKQRKIQYPDYKILRWTHPSPLSDRVIAPLRKFANCDHFKRVPEINWKCLGSGTTIFTDGAVKMCEPRIASYGVYVSGGTLAKLTLSGRVYPNVYNMEHYIISPNTEITTQCSSQRGEYVALCYALLMCIRIGIPSPITIVSDSRNALMTIKEWYENKKDKSKFANLDLVKIMYSLFTELKSTRTIQLIHINSHQRGDSPDVVANNYVDKIAKNALCNNTYDIVVQNSIIRIF